MMNTSEIAWVAGLLEGEGCFTPQRERKYTPMAVYPKIQMTSVDLDVLERLKQLVGGSICGPLPIRKPTHTPTYQWRLGGQGARQLMSLVLPLMGERRQAQITAAQEEIEQASRGKLRPRRATKSLV